MTSHRLAGKHILLGVCGGIAAYKAAELTRALRQEGGRVRVVMTQAATAFVAPLTFQALSGEAVHLDLLDAAAESAMGHIELARWADLIVVAPATADFLARLRAGLADDLLSCICLAATVPLIVVPAMNQAMWCHAATQDNVATLSARGVRILGPAAGPQACGETGLGRMLEPADLVESLAAGEQAGLLRGLKLLISAGPTREPLDPVRYLSNRSSGKMGYALAEVAALLGAEVILVSGPTALSPPAAVETIRVESAEAMYRAVLDRAGAVDVYIGAAAVADYTPVSSAPHKIKKGEATITLSLRKTPDILAAVAGLPVPPFTVGFAAETEALEAHARQKLEDKGLDMVAANRVGPGLGFETDDNALLVCWAGGSADLPKAPKRLLAEQLLRLIQARYHAKHSAENPR